MVSSHQTITHSKSSNIFYKYGFMSISNELNHSKQILSSSNHNPLTSLERTSTHSIIGTNTTRTSSSNNEHEPITWNEDETLILQSSASSNDDDYEHEIISTDNDESHQQQVSHQQFQMITGTPTIIYV